MRGGLLILLAALLVACAGAIDAGLCAWTLFAAMLFLAGAAVEGAESVGDGAAKGVVGIMVGGVEALAGGVEVGAGGGGDERGEAECGFGEFTG
ncbi:MAG: hypothetical protein ACK6D7_08820, partial [Acidobacteriota bacterium]